MQEKELIRDQAVYASETGTFGPLGSIRKNGCGSIALYNVLQLLGYPAIYQEILNEMKRHWIRATILGGILGSKPLYLLGFLRRKKDLSFTFYQIRNCRYIMIRMQISMQIILTKSRRFTCWLSGLTDAMHEKGAPGIPIWHPWVHTVPGGLRLLPAYLPTASGQN